MAAKKIGDTTVHLQTPDGVVVYGPGDTVPAAHAKLVTNSKVWADDSEDDESEPSK